MGRYLSKMMHDSHYAERLPIGQEVLENSSTNR
jgi:zinc protease